jgi:hypothetical protein
MGRGQRLEAGSHRIKLSPFGLPEALGVPFEIPVLTLTRRMVHNAEKLKKRMVQMRGQLRLNSRTGHLAPQMKAMIGAQKP